MSSDEETVQVVVNVPKSVKETAQDKLEYGGLTREVREALQRVAFGEDLNQRSRLERQLEELQDEREELRNQRRELDADIEAVDNKINGVQNSLNQLSTEEDRYEAKLEELEYRLRDEGTRLWPTNGNVARVAKEAGKEPEGVVQDLKERNPDVPDIAFEEGKLYSNEPSWNGVDEEDIELDVEDREERYR